MKASAESQRTVGKTDVPGSGISLNMWPPGKVLRYFFHVGTLERTPITGAFGETYGLAQQVGLA